MLETKFVNTPPPGIYERAVEKFGVSFEDVVFTVGDTIHAKYSMPPDLIVHEQVHIKQQAEYGVEEWWDRYFEDNDFRFSQELPAHQAQYRWLKNNIKDRNQLNRKLIQLAQYLASETYGNLVSVSKAIKLIKC